MKTVSAAEMRELDARTINEFGIPGEVLMDRAGKGVADAVLDVIELTGRMTPSVLLVAGCGNNGGDAFAAARYLAWEGVRTEIWLAGAMSMVEGDAKTHLRRLLDTGLKVRELPDSESWRVVSAEEHRHHIVVDGVLGTGIRGHVRDVAESAVAYINNASSRSLVVAIDVPSGMDANTGVAIGNAVAADITVTMGLPKKGFAESPGIALAGSVAVADIGTPPALIDSIEAGTELTVLQDIRQLIARRNRASHKGTYGHVLVVGGSVGFSGAVAMAAKAALRSGAGLVTAIVPRSVAAQTACMAQEIMVHPADETEEKTLSGDLWSKVDPDLFDAILLGPGMGKHAHARLLLKNLLHRSKKPVVLDADAISAQRCEDRSVKSAYCPVVMTPHPGEMGSFMGMAPAEVQADRAGTASRAADATNSVIVLKGAGTIVACRLKPLAVNSTGNPGMATAGMGDALAGLLAGLLAQGLEARDAARAAVWIHGRAGDRVSLRMGQTGMVAGDVIGEIPATMKEVTSR